MGVTGAVVLFILAGLKVEGFGRAGKLPNTSKSALLRWCPGKTTPVLTSDRPQHATSGAGEVGDKRAGGDLESERKREGKKAGFSMLFIKVCSLTVSVKVTGAFMSTWRVPTLVCKAKQ